MRERPKSARTETVSLHDSESGVLAGFWLRALSGYEWDDGFEVSEFDGPVPGGRPLSEMERDFPWLCPIDHASDALFRRYPMLRDRNLLRDFASLANEPTMDGIKAFADRWGLLGRPRRMFKPDWDFAIDVESLSVWAVELQEFQVLWETAQAVSILLAPARQTRTRTAAATALLEQRIRWSGGPNGPRVTYHEGDTIVGRRSGDLPALFNERWTVGWSIIADTWIRPELLEFFESGDTIAPARFYVGDAVNTRLRGHVDLAVLPFHERMRFFPDSLLTAIYVLFAQDLVGSRGREMTCEFCHQPFLMGRRDQRFCDKNCREAGAYHRRKKERSNGQKG